MTLYSSFIFFEIIVQYYFVYCAVLFCFSLNQGDDVFAVKTAEIYHN